MMRPDGGRGQASWVCGGRHRQRVSFVVGSGPRKRRPRWAPILLLPCLEWRPESELCTCRHCTTIGLDEYPLAPRGKAVQTSEGASPIIRPPEARGGAKARPQWPPPPQWAFERELTVEAFAANFADCLSEWVCETPRQSRPRRGSSDVASLPGEHSLDPSAGGRVRLCGGAGKTSR